MFLNFNRNLKWAREWMMLHVRYSFWNLVCFCIRFSYQDHGISSWRNKNMNHIRHRSRTQRFDLSEFTSSLSAYHSIVIRTHLTRIWNTHTREHTKRWFTCRGWFLNLLHRPLTFPICSSNFFHWPSLISITNSTNYMKLVIYKISDG